ncbi:thrombospondin-type laminin G domain and EAR repeat-containing protein isoform X1 [Kryptolebias marmoratus]|uniref:Thrombospondin-type laminin G domain and EAR repeats a n=1 Tax=Kryptolebias marmoratus TaxID=37003 RepID=A0A3Q3AX19_KRYMA|nr:thrombospondin-type laminin G domain and EAR repeat-containing protein isoform X1 [Kryptolebias marmoratus]
MSEQIFILFLLWGLRVTDTTTGTWKQCTDLLPLDLLSFVLERDTSKLVPGVSVKQALGVRGVHFLSPDASMSFPSSQILVNCDLFPKEFSIVLTFKVNRITPKRNEYIFSLLEPKNAAEEMEESLQKDKTKNLSGEELGMKKKHIRKHEEPGRVILGLKLSQSGLHFFFKGQEEAVKRWVFRGTPLADNQWHTLVFVIDHHHMRLTVDCKSPLEIIPSRPFPSDLNIQGSRVHIGSRGRWKGLFSGLLRQLVLVPNSDATHQMCPSSDPQLAALSVPPLLLDLPVRKQQDDRRLTSSESAQPVSVGLESSCSELLQGQLWFNPLKKGLYVCNGSAWITVLEDHKRLDYVLEHQVLTTSSETHDVEVFQIPGVGLMAAMAHRSSASGSAVYLWIHSGFQLYQNISTYGALAWRHFRMGKKVFLVVSNSGAGTDRQPNKGSEMDFSVIYKWSNRRKRFVQFQTLQTYCARDWEAFSISQHTYLAVANHRQGDNNHTINSVIYRWNRSTKSFEVHQMLLTSGAYDWEFFTVGPYHFLVVANAFDGVTTSVDSVIYIWIDGRFQVFQTIKTFCATDWEMFQIGSRVFLVVANGHRLSGNRPSQYTINSTIYELDMSGQLFVRFQDIVTHSAVDWEFFSLGEEYFLVVANSYNGESYSLNSILYRWQGYEGFVPVHWLPTIGCSDWEFFSSKGESYLIYSSAKTPLTKVFKLKTY